MRLFLSLIALLLTFSLAAQSRKGSLLLAGDTRADVRAATNISTQFWDAGSSRIGYFLLDELVLGAEISLRTNIFAFQTPEDFRINPFARYYLTEIEGRKTTLFTQIGFGTFGAFSDFGSTASYETDFHAGVGGELQIADNLLAEGLLRYNAKAFGLNYTELSLRINVLVGNGRGKTEMSLVAKDFMINPSGGNVQLGVRGREGVTHLIADLNLEAGMFLSNNFIFESGFNMERDAYRADPGNSEGVRDRPLITQITGYVGGRLLLPAEGVTPYVQTRLSHFSQTTGFDDQFGRRSSTQSTGQIGVGGGALVFIAKNVAFDLGLRRQFALQQFFLDQWEGSAGLKVFISHTDRSEGRDN